LIAIKVNIIDDLETMIKQYEAFEASLVNCDQGSSSRRLKDNYYVMEEIKIAFFGRKMENHLKIIEEQKKHLQVYFGHAQKINPILLPGLIQPRLLLLFFVVKSADYSECLFRFAEGYFSRHCSAKLAIRTFLYPLLAPNAKLPSYKWDNGMFVEC
jgi:hypothetical protein